MRAGSEAKGRQEVERCGAGRTRLVTFVYDGCAEDWTVEGTDSDVFATVRGRRMKVTNTCREDGGAYLSWVGPDGSLYRRGELRGVKEQVVWFGHVANAPVLTGAQRPGRCERWGKMGRRAD